MKIFAAHNPDSDIRRKSSAGGVFTILALHTLEAGGVVYGAAFDSDWTVAHCRIERKDELWRLRGSKYAYSRLEKSIINAAADIAAGRKVLFSGTPCQIAAARQRIGGSPLLLLVEVVCHGAPEAKYWDRYLDELCAANGKTRSEIKSISFRDKRTGWKNYSFMVRFSDGSEFSQPHDDNIYMRAFLKDLTLRDACFRCPFKYPDGSRADITIGDFWGISPLTPHIDNDFGTTIVIASTPVGEAAASPIEAMATPSYTDIVRYNPAIAYSPTKPAQRARFIADVGSADSLTKTMRRYAARSLRETIYLTVARFKHLIFKLIKR